MMKQLVVCCQRYLYAFMAHDEIGAIAKELELSADLTTTIRVTPEVILRFPNLQNLLTSDEHVFLPPV